MPPPDYYKAKKSNWGAKKTTSKKGKGRKSSKVAQKGTKTKEILKKISKEAEKRYERQKVIDAALKKRDTTDKKTKDTTTKDTTTTKKDEGILGLMAKIGHGEVLDDYIGDTAWLAKYKTGQHKLRSQFDRLRAKYGDDFLKTTQAKVLANYLSGVPVERGGGLGARDDTYGGGEFSKVDEFGNFITDEELAEAEEKREALLQRVASGKVTGDELTNLFRDQTQADIGKGLSESQWANFRQQLMAADPSPGNQAYKAALPWSSGSGLTALMEKVTPGSFVGKNILGGLFPKQSEWKDWKANQQIFKDTSVPELGGGDDKGIAGLPASTTPFTDVNNNGILDHLEVAQATTTPATTTTTPAQTTFASAVTPFDYDALAPQFGPQYPGHYSHWGWGYANGGIVSKARPQQYIEWKKIIKTFPEMV